MPSNKTIQLLSLGNTIIDLEYRVSDDTLSQLSIEKASMTLIEKDQKDALISKLGTPVHQCNGGSTANSIYVASLFNISTGHLGVIGNDSLGAFAFDDYKKTAIKTSFDDTTVDGDTACCLVLITPDGERTMLTYLGKSAHFPAGNYIETMIGDSNCLFIEGYLLADDHAFNLIKTIVLPTAKATNTKIAFTLSDAGLASFFKERFMFILENKIDYLFANLGEAVTISEKNQLDDILESLATYSDEVVVTDGSKGAYTYANNECITHQTLPLTATDTTGAGDAFAGTYLAQRLQGKSIQESGERSNIIAGTVISNYGARPAELMQHFKKPVNN